MLFYLIFALSYYSLSSQQCTYKGAVYEHVIQGNVYDPPRELIKANLGIYQRIVTEAAKKGAQIIVFPEYGLTGYYDDRYVMHQYLEIIPNKLNSSKKVNPCNDFSHENVDHQILHTLSCAAKENNIFIVANMGELSLEPKKRYKDLINISPCNASTTKANFNMFADLSMLMMNKRWLYRQDFGGTVTPPKISSSVFTSIKQYNTDVVFDSAGNLVAKYRKCHLCGENNYDYPATCDIVTFDTPFAGTFGIFTCFDINWKHPAVDILEQNGIRGPYIRDALLAIDSFDGDDGVKNVVFPTMWPDILPFITAIGVQSSYAVRMNVNVLAANVHYTTLYGERGSGIYAGASGALNYTYTPLPMKGKLLISDIPCSPPPDQNIGGFLVERSTTSQAKSAQIKTNDIGDLLDMAWSQAGKDHFANSDTLIHNNWLDGEKTKIKDIWTNGVENGLPATNESENYRLDDKVAYVVIPPPLNDSDYQDLKTAQQCFGELCCTLTYKFARPPNTFLGTKEYGIMVLGAYDQLHPDFVSWYLRICAFTVCPTMEPSSCGAPTLASDARFSHFTLAGNFSGINVAHEPDTTYVFPIVLTDGAQLPGKKQWQFAHKNTIRAERGFVEPILSAALWGRVFDKDLPSPIDSNHLSDS